MIGIVIISHSAALATGIRALARQMVRDSVPIAIAGGVDDPQDSIGTDPFRVLSAIESVYSEDGVIVFMDLGSAVLSAETALDFLPAEQRAHVHLCAAPLVEGVIAAAVRAMAGGALADVLAEAGGALAAKTAQLQPAATPNVALSVDAAPDPFSDASAADAHTFTLRVQNPLGLHARPAARIANTVGRFDAQVSLTKGQTTVAANSINQILALTVEQGDFLTFDATGPEATPALAALRRLAAANFAEPETEPVPLPDPRVSAGINRTADSEGLPVAPGIACGPLVLYRPLMESVRETNVSDVVAEWTRLQQALAAAQADVNELQHQREASIGEAEAAIFTAQVALLADPDLRQLAHDFIVDHRLNAEAAWLRVTAAVSRRFARAEQPYWHQRIADVQDVQERVLQLLTGVENGIPNLERPAILVAEDLPPTIVARLPPGQILGIITERGGATSHSAILARSLGIPMVVGVTGVAGRLKEGQSVALDGYTGRIWFNPDHALRTAVAEVRQRVKAVQEAAITEAHLPAILRDGKRVAVQANIGSVPEAERALAQGADGVGLFRSEFLFMNRSLAPNEEEQWSAYRTAAAALAGRPLTIRTLDLGGDKPVDHLALPYELNPVLGWRGIRDRLGRPELARTQLRAVLRTAVDYPVKLMFPMVSTLDELWEAFALLEAAEQELQAAAVPYAAAETIEMGVMIETPAAVFLAPQLASVVDFFSIGTNDLTQYIMAADRTNPQVAALVQPLQPAVLRAVQLVVQAAHQCGIRVAVCGELAGEPRAAALLVGLGVDELSMNLPAIAGVKTALRELTLPQTIALAEGALNQATAVEVERYLRRQLPA